MRPEIRSAIERAAREHGVDPSFALAVADRESGGDVNARSSKTIAGIYQMMGSLRRQYGAGDSTDAYRQASGWMKFIKATKAQTAASLGRDPTDPELYLSHHFGGVRAARMMKMDPATPVDQVFTRQERRLNPHFDKAGTVGALNSSVLADIDKRQAKFGAAPDYSEAGAPVFDPGISGKNPDFSPFGVAADQPQPSVQQPTGAPDFSPFGVPA